MDNTTINLLDIVTFNIIMYIIKYNMTFVSYVTYFIDIFWIFIWNMFKDKKNVAVCNNHYHVQIHNTLLLILAMILGLVKNSEIVDTLQNIW